MPAKFKISDAVRGVLASADIDERSVRLKSGQLDRKLYLEVNKVLEGAGGKWNRKAGAHIFEHDPRPLLGLAVENGVGTNLQQLHQSFYTPPAVADQMVKLSGLSYEMPLLEPSAGEGALLDAAFGAVPDLREYLAFETDPRALAVLSKKGYEVFNEDFLSVDYSVLPSYSVVLMNPPFSGDQAPKHIRKALHMVAECGCLISVIPRGMMDKKGKAYVDLKYTIGSMAHGYETIDLPDESFKQSGTLVRTSLLVVRR